MQEYKHSKTQITAKKANGGDFPPSLKIDFFNGNPTIFVSTGFKKGNGITYIRAGLEPKTADMILEAILMIADMPADPENNITAVFECKAGKEKELRAKVVVGKTKQGLMFISVIDAKNTEAPMIQFLFGYDLYHPVTTNHLPSTITDKELISVIAAKGWANRCRAYWHHSLVNYVPEENPNNNNKGNWNKNNNSSGGSSNTVTDVELDDVWG